MHTTKEITQIIKARRKELQLNQSELAGLAGLSIEGLSKIERGDAQPKLTTVLKLIRLLGGNIDICWNRNGNE